MKMLCYPAYKRRNNGRTVRVGRFIVDNRYIVQYNAGLLKKYKSHINIKACASVKSIQVCLQRSRLC